MRACSSNILSPSSFEFTSQCWHWKDSLLFKMDAYNIWIKILPPQHTKYLLCLVLAFYIKVCNSTNRRTITQKHSLSYRNCEKSSSLSVFAQNNRSQCKISKNACLYNVQQRKPSASFQSWFFFSFNHFLFVTLFPNNTFKTACLCVCPCGEGAGALKSSV